MSYIEPKCLLKAKNWIQNVRNPSGEIWGLSFAVPHSAPPPIYCKKNALLLKLLHLCFCFIYQQFVTNQI